LQKQNNTILYLTDLETNGQEIADGIAKQYGIEVMYSNANMLQPAELRKMVADAVTKFGKLMS
jgi:3-hydroxybutyrate dehydrogenase